MKIYKSKLKLIARQHAKGTLLATDVCAFDDTILNEEERNYIVSEIHKIADRIIRDNEHDSISNSKDIISNVLNNIK